MRKYSRYLCIVIGESYDENQKLNKWDVQNFETVEKAIF